MTGSTRPARRQHGAHGHSHNSMSANRVDPTGTKTLRTQFERQFNKRWRRLKGLINKGVGRQDRLGLRDRQEGHAPGGNVGGNAGEGGPERPPAPTPTPDSELPADLPAQPFKYPSDEAKIMYFNNWVEQAQDDLLTTDQTPSEYWGAEYTAYAYEQGLENARGHLEERGVSVPESAIGETFNLPIHQQTLQGLYTRQYKGLEAITQEAGRQISDVLTEGFLEGVNPRVMASRMNDRIDSVGMVRSRMLARTEVIRAHNEASLSRYERVLGSDADVGIVAEFRTAGDNRVCDLCKSLQGTRYSIKEARNLIPGRTHPNCRCTWVPITRHNQ